jgi:glycosyltransferase involved in cell wall biosynthesis
VTRPRVVLLRGHNTNVWDLRPLEALQDRYDLRALVTGANLHDLTGLALPTERVRTPRDALPAGRVAGAAAYALGERYLGLEDHLRGAAVVHAAEIGTWFAAQAAALKPKLGYKLVLTVWETLPWRATYRWPRERRYREAVLGQIDLCLAATERARQCLLLEGVTDEKIVVCPPGIALERFTAAGAAPATASAAEHTVLSAARLVWEKGHQDVLRAVAALGRDDVRLLVVGSGPEESKLKAYAQDLGVRAEFRATIPYDAMPDLYASASALVLASLPTKAWEEQFGMVLVEARAAGTPVVTTTSGAIPEVVGDEAALVAPGDWRGIADALEAGPLAGAPAARRAPDPSWLARYDAAGVAARVQDAYDRVLADSER